MTGCCSEGYCTHEIVCEGNKVAGEFCDRNEECISEFCFNYKCAIKSFIFPLWFWLVIIGISIMLVIFMVCIFMCSKSGSRLRSYKSSSFDKTPLLRGYENDYDKGSGSFDLI